MDLLVTGATGHLGSRVVETLLDTAPDAHIGVSVRDPQQAEALRARGVEVRRGDFDEPDSLDTAFAGVRRLLLVSTTLDNATRIRQHRAAVTAAERAGVEFLAYTSMAAADTSPISLAEVHRATEATIRETGIPFSFLRNNWYAENEAGTVAAAAAGAPVLTSAGDGRVGWAARADYADAAAAVLAGDGHDNTVYELSGTPRTYAELAAAIGEALGREVPVQPVDDEAYAAAMTDAGLPGPVVTMLVDVQRGVREGALDVESGDLEALLGRPQTPLEDVLARLASG